MLTSPEEVERTGHFMSFIRLYSMPEVRVRFTRRAREEFVTHAEVGMHMIGCNPGHVCQDDN